MNKTVVLDDLIVSNIKPYFDVTGSYMDHLEGTMNREPTSAEMKTLEKEYRIVSLTGCFHPIGSAPIGWNEQNQRFQGNMDSSVSSKTVATGLWNAFLLLTSIPCGIYVIFKLVVLLIVPQIPPPP